MLERRRAYRLNPLLKLCTSHVLKRVRPAGVLKIQLLLSESYRMCVSPKSRTPTAPGQRLSNHDDSESFAIKTLHGDSTPDCGG